MKNFLYGLKQASRAWNHKLNTALLVFGLSRSEVDPCIYYSVRKDSMLYVAVYVDDLLIFTNDQQVKHALKANLMQRFKMKDIGKASCILGMQIERNRQSVTLNINQSRYIKDVLSRFGILDNNPISTPMDHTQKLSAEMCPKNNTEMAEMKDVPYQEAIGSIVFAAQITRPDICFAVNSVSRYVNNPGKPHWMAVKRILRYLKGTISAKLEFSNNTNSTLTGYCDADWASDLDHRNNTGYVFKMQGGAVSWNVRKQPTIALSTAEAEYMSLAAASQEAIWLKQVHDEIIRHCNSVMLYCDNKSAIDLAADAKYHARSKHIDIRYHFIREKIADKLIKLHYISTENMLADMFTKQTVSQKHLSFSKCIGLKFEV